MSGAQGETLVLVADDDADVRELVVFRLERAFSYDWRMWSLPKAVLTAWSTQPRSIF